MRANGLFRKSGSGSQEDLPTRQIYSRVLRCDSLKNAINRFSAVGVSDEPERHLVTSSNACASRLRFSPRPNVLALLP